MNLPNPSDDYLWNPKATPDPQIVQLEEVLRTCSAAARGLPQRVPKAGTARGLRKLLTIAAVVTTLTIGTVLLSLHHRLSWNANAPWQVTIASNGSVAGSSSMLLHTGSRLTVRPNQTAAVKIARIGHAVLAPDSTLRLIRTAKGAHRLQLERGRLTARVWAPPQYFGIAVGDALILDLGCAFDVAVEDSGRMTLRVSSGWVLYDTSGQELLIPAGYGMSLQAGEIASPLHGAASSELLQWTQQLDALLASNADASEITAVAEHVAAAAAAPDYFTLLSLLTRHPALARGPLYQRLATLLGVRADAQHRSAWASGDTAAIDQWWSRIDNPPKAWWLHWRDGLWSE